MFKKLKEKIKNITPKQAILGTIAGTAGVIISAPLTVAVGAGYLVKTIKDVKDENKKEIEEKKKEIEEKNLNEEKLNKFMLKIDDNIIPESFICPITQSIMIDPVISPYGISYEKYAIENWLIKNNVDPFSQKPLKKEQLVRNYALKNAIREFVVNYKKECEKKNNALNNNNNNVLNNNDNNVLNNNDNNVLNNNDNNIHLNNENNKNNDDKKNIDVNDEKKIYFKIGNQIEKKLDVRNDNFEKKENIKIDNSDNKKNENGLFEEKNEIYQNEKNKDFIIDNNNENNCNIVVDKIKDNAENNNNEDESKKINMNNLEIHES